jgi:hypothetical protein
MKNKKNKPFRVMNFRRLFMQRSYNGIPKMNFDYYILSIGEKD